MAREYRPRAHNSTLPRPQKPMRKINPERLKKLRAKQFGTDGKREWVLSMRCGVTGLYGWAENPMEPAHTGSPDPDVRGQSTRGAGADDTFLFPMLHLVHADFDSLPEAKFEELYGVSKQWVREYAEDLDREWLRLCEKAALEL